MGCGRVGQELATCLPLQQLLAFSSYSKFTVECLWWTQSEVPREWEGKAGQVLSLSGTDGITPKPMSWGGGRNRAYHLQPTWHPRSPGLGPGGARVLRGRGQGPWGRGGRRGLETSGSLLRTRAPCRGGGRCEVCRRRRRLETRFHITPVFISWLHFHAQPLFTSAM